MSETIQKRWHWLMGSGDLYVSYQQCLALCLPDDALLLMGRHVWLLTDPRLQSETMVKTYALSESVEQAGLSGQVPPFVELVNWNQVLDLLQRHYPLQQTWV